MTAHSRLAYLVALLPVGLRLIPRVRKADEATEPISEGGIGRPRYCGNSRSAILVPCLLSKAVSRAWLMVRVTRVRPYCR
jgi:hypothetical protein